MKKKLKKDVIFKNGKLRGEIVEKSEKNDINKSLNDSELANETIEEDSNYVSIEDLIDPLKKYEYVEEKRKFNYKIVVFYLFVFVIIFLILFSSKLINDKLIKSNKVPVVENTTSTTTKYVTTTVPEIVITHSLSCSLDMSNQGVYQKNFIKFNFSNSGLVKTDYDYFVSLTDEAYIDKYNELIQYLKIVSLSFDEDNMELNSMEENYSYRLTVNVDLSNGFKEYGFAFGESYEEVINKMRSMNYICE